MGDACPPIQPDALIEVHLVSKRLELKVRHIIKERTLTVSSIANYDVQSFSTNKDEIDVLLLLKEKSNLLLSRPLSRIQSRKIFRASSVPAQKLVYRESRGDGFDGYFHALDLVSKLQRTKKLVAKGKAHEAKEKERTKYGQVAQVPNKLKWTFSWTEIKHPNLEKYLKDPTSVVNYKHMLSGELTELVDHLVAELFVYFRKGIPNYYMNKFLDKLVEDFPCFSDQSTCLGYSLLRPLITNSFRSMVEQGLDRGKKRKVEKKVPSTASLRKIEDKDLVLEVFQAHLATQSKVEQKLNEKACVISLEPPSLRYNQYVSQVIAFFRTFRSNKKTTFNQFYPRFKFEYCYEEPPVREQIALHLLHLSLPTSDLIVESTCSGKGIHFRLDEGSTFDDLPNGSILTGSVFASGMSVIDHVTVTDGIFIICAINTILGIRCPDEHEHFLTFVEKEFMGISRSCHTVYTSQFKKALNRKTGGKKKASRDNLEDDLSLISDGMSNHSN